MHLLTEKLYPAPGMYLQKDIFGEIYISVFVRPKFTEKI
jgi:hypothetical protein